MGNLSCLPKLRAWSKRNSRTTCLCFIARDVSQIYWAVPMYLGDQLGWSICRCPANCWPIADPEQGRGPQLVQGRVGREGGTHPIQLHSHARPPVSAFYRTKDVSLTHWLGPSVWSQVILLEHLVIVILELRPKPRLELPYWVTTGPLFPHHLSGEQSNLSSLILRPIEKGRS